MRGFYVFAQKRKEGYWSNGYHVAQEFYLPLNDYKQKSFDRSRSFVGLFRALSRFDEIEFYFMFQNQLNPLKQRKQDFVYGIGYAKEF